MRPTLAAVLGSIVYRVVVALALRVEWLKPTDLKLITAVIVVFALVVPSINRSLKQRSLAKRRSEEINVLTNGKQAGGGF